MTEPYTQKSVIDMTEEEFRAYIDEMDRRFREPYGDISDRAWELIRELRKHKMTGKSSLGFPMTHRGLGAFAERVVQHYTDMKAKAIVKLIIRQALADFVIASEPFRLATRQQPTKET